ncbi:hypothetical protein G3I44_14520 [Halogeometricum borinquense]|uniref:Uncharacterized protein n=1 Tax=Halogeometricum borinquense TaxID=60847 RepID=A0A6C0UM04_9EURY|nr:hypothetical protein [Halogeometricum borinquense]QIB75401.1 hypothetical protein G3I44_14520 [Halogeometricum borinquense]
MSEDRETNRQPDKTTFPSNVRREGGSLVTSIPPEIIDHNEIQEGDTIEWQKEHTEKHGNYSSSWNPRQQEEQEQPAEANTPAQ